MSKPPKALHAFEVGNSNCSHGDSAAYFSFNSIRQDADLEQYPGAMSPSKL